MVSQSNSKTRGRKNGKKKGKTSSSVEGSDETSPGAEQPDSARLALISNALGNPVRLKILSNLARGEKYILQLVRETGYAQQVIYRHLKYLEKKGLIKSETRDYSEYKGKDVPPSRRRKYYSIDHTLSIHVDIGPFLFHKDVTLFSKNRMTQLPATLKDDLAEIDALDDAGDYQLQLFEKLVELEALNKELEEKRHKILVQRHCIHERLKHILNDIFPSPDEQEIAYKLIERQHSSVDELARTLDVHPATIREVLEMLQEHISFPFLDGD